MAATKLQANWTAVMHGSTAITRVSDVQFDQGGSLAVYSADDNIYPVVAVNLMNNPKASLTTADPGTVMGLGVGTSGSFTATHKDAKAATGGAIVYTLANATIENISTGGQHAQYGTASLSMIGISSDGTTNPLSFTRS